MSSDDPIVKVQNIDVNQLELQFPKGESTNKNGFFVHVRHNKFRVRTLLPDLKAPYGAGPQKDLAKNGEQKYSMGICFDGMETDSKLGIKIGNAHAALERIQDKLKELMIEHREAFFKDAKPKSKKEKPLSDEVLEARFKSFLRIREDRSDIMYLSIQRRRVKKEDEDKLTPEEKSAITRQFSSLAGYPLLVDKDGHVLEVDTDNIKDVIPWGSVIRPIIELAYLWVSTANLTVQPVWTFIHGARISTGPQKTFDILRADTDSEGEDEETKMERSDTRSEDQGTDDAMEETDPHEEDLEMAQ
jgi:hypothetical protein